MKQQTLSGGSRRFTSLKSRSTYSFLKNHKYTSVHHSLTCCPLFNHPKKHLPPKIHHSWHAPPCPPLPHFSLEGVRILQKYWLGGGGGGGKKFLKKLGLGGGGGGSEIFILVGDVLWLGESNFVGESPEILKENLKL